MVKIKKNNDENDFEFFLKNFKDKKPQTIKKFEEIKENIIIKIDKEIELLYQKKESIQKVYLTKLDLIKHKISVWKKIQNTKFNVLFRYIISMPFIYMMWIPAIILHIFLEVYHQICFRLYKIPLVNPKDYFIFDRKNLLYLNWFEKFNCFYCSYFNCLIAYAGEIAGRTERYWCPIKHSKRMLNSHSQYKYFVEYNNAEELREQWNEIRKF